MIEKCAYKAFTDLKPKSAMFILLKSIGILKPIVNLLKRSRRISKKKRKRITLVPRAISLPQQYKLAISWLINFIRIQKKTRRRHRYKNVIKLLQVVRGMSKSKKKTFYDRFQIAYAKQQLNNLIKNKFDELDDTKYVQLVRKKLHIYVAVTNNRINNKFRY
jgi:putative ribosome biogenesis GTPase RsgA